MTVPIVKFKKLSMLYLRIPGHRSIYSHDLYITRSISVCKERQKFKFISKERLVVRYQNEWPNALLREACGYSENHTKFYINSTVKQSQAAHTVTTVWKSLREH